MKKAKLLLLKAGALAAALGVLAFCAVGSGLVPIKASSGHSTVTVWFLHFAMKRSVATHTIGLKAPNLGEPHLALRGAGHYETGCRPCHGSPGHEHPGFAKAMLPPPPYLPPRVKEWKPEALFYVVKHGVKFTGMPAWPTQERDDEVWAMVAFLRKMPDLDAESYERLVHGEAPSFEPAAPLRHALGVEPAAKVPGALVASCARCHGVGGLGRGLGAFPKLAGQRREYLARSMRAYARGERHSGTMQPIAAGLDEEATRKLVDYYADLPPGGEAPGPSSPDAVARGREIAFRGIPGRRVPACASCHGPAETEKNPAYPRVAGQYAEYIALQLELFKHGKRGGTEYAHLMRRVAAGLEPGEMRDVASYYASLPWPGGTAP